MVLAAFSRLLGALGLAGSPRNELEEKIDRAIVSLEMLEDRIAEIRYRFEQRSRELFEKVVRLYRRGERSRAAIYAGEVSQVRNTLKVIIAFQNIIEMTKERLKTVRDTRELGKILMVFGAAIEDIKDQVTNLYPNLGMAFEEINRKVRTLMIETSIDAVHDIDPAVITSDAMQVLQEAMKKAEEKIREDFPEPPVEPVIAAKATPAAAEPLAIAAPAAVATAPAPRKPDPETLEKLVLDYIRSHNGYLDIRDFTTRYNVEKSDVLQALHRLAEKGLIALA